MTYETLIDGEGAAFTVGVANANSYPTDYQGAQTATNTSSILHQSQVTQLLGYTIMTTTGAGALISLRLHSGAIPGLTNLDASALGSYDLSTPEGIIFDRSNNANLGITCPAGVTAILHWRKFK